MNYKFFSFLYFMLGFILLSNKGLHAQNDLMRDPTRPLIVEVVETDKNTKKEESIVLQSIIISPTRRLALINDQYVKVGERVGLYKLDAIHKNSVELSQPGQKRTIYLFD